MIDDKLQQELRAKYNPEGSQLRQHQLRTLEILKVVDSICKTNNINYWLSSGTLLGAVRHKGFIPWDDDIDIEMLRDDFKKFNEVIPQYLPDNLKLQNHQTDKCYYWPFAKVRDERYPIKEKYNTDIRYKYHGVYIDIFCIEKGTLFLSRISKWLHYKLCLGRSCYKSTPKLYLSLIYGVLTYLVYPFFRLCLSFRTDSRLYQTFGTGFHKHREMKDLFPLTQIEFEGHLFNAPKDTHAYLQRIYGDYMELPNKNKIVFHI